MTDPQDRHRADSLLTPRPGIDDPFAAAVRATRMPMIIADAQAPDMPIVFANEAFLSLSGYRRDEVLGRNCRFLQGPETDQQAVAELSSAIADNRAITVDLVNYKKDGTPFWNALQISPVLNTAGELVFFIGSQVDVTERKLAEAKLHRDRQGLRTVADEQSQAAEKALAERTALLHEVDHRVKNNLQLISSLLVLQTRRTSDPATREALERMLSRVSAIATVHRRLFQSQDIARFDVGAFVRDLLGDVTAGSEGQVEMDLQRIDIAAAQAAPLALVVNELVDNAHRHGAPADGEAHIELTVRRLNGHYVICVRDHGPGLPETGEFTPGFGLTITELLAQQLRATLSFEAAEPGVRAVLKLPVEA